MNPTHPPTQTADVDPEVLKSRDCFASTGPAAPVLSAVGVKKNNLSLTWSLCYLAPEDGWPHRRAGWHLLMFNKGFAEIWTTDQVGRPDELYLYCIMLFDISQ